MTFLEVLPFTQVIVVAFAAVALAAVALAAVVGAAVVAAGAGAGAGVVIDSFALNLIESFAWLKVKPCAVNLKY